MRHVEYRISGEYIQMQNGCQVNISKVPVVSHRSAPLSKSSSIQETKEVTTPTEIPTPSGTILHRIFLVLYYPAVCTSRFLDSQWRNSQQAAKFPANRGKRGAFDRRSAGVGARCRETGPRRANANINPN